MATWNDRKPELSDPLSEFPSMFSNQATSIASAMEQHFYWTANSGASAGIPASSATTGSARAFFGTQSQVSSSASTTILKAPAGRLMVTSDTSRLFGLTSGASLLLGSFACITHLNHSNQTITSGSRWLRQSGAASAATGYLNTHVAFSPAYSVAPVVLVTSTAQDKNNLTSVHLTGLDTSGFTFTVVPESTFGTAISPTVYWLSTGTVAL